MGIFTALPNDLKEVDVIIAGGGTAGCVVAGRLAEADPKLAILVIEAGPDNYNRTDVVNPLLWLSHITHPEWNTHHYYPASKSVHLGDRIPVVSTGGLLGGGSSINACMYTRAQRSDFDSWNTPGWTADELLPFLRKTYHGPTDAPSTHGTSGPVQVSSGTFVNSAVEEDFVAAASATGYPEIVDLQNLSSNNGFQRRWQRWIDQSGKRQDAAHAYLHPRLQDGKHPNLHVLVQTRVVRVLFSESGEGKKASGVEVVPDATWQADQTDRAPKTVTARRLVILSAGSFGSPTILERSGIGSREVIQRAGVEVVAEVPGVGEGMQDHAAVLTHYKTNLAPGQTCDEIYSNRVSVASALESGDKRLGWNLVDFSGKIRPTDQEVTALGADYKAAWDRDFKDKPDRPLALAIFVSGFFGDVTVHPVGQYAGVVLSLMYPNSRGHVHITGPNVEDPLDHQVPFLGDTGDIDLKSHIWGYKKTREIMRRTNMYAGEVPLCHPVFPEGSRAGLADAPIHGSVKDLEYTAEDEVAIESFIRDRVATLWHSLGTARMAPREKMGVVDGSLDVYGVMGLKVMDLSIVPSNVGGNTNSTALLIGEKGASLAAEYLGLGSFK